MNSPLTDLQDAAHRALEQALHAREDRVRCEKTLSTLRDKELSWALAAERAANALKHAQEGTCRV